MKMKSLHHLQLLTFLLLLLLATQTSLAATDRRILHQPLYPETDPPPPTTESPTTPYLNPDIPFSPELPNPDQPTNPSPPSPSQLNNDHSSAGAVPIPAAPQPTKKLAIAISVGIVSLGMLSALVFFLFRHRAKQSSDAQKLFDDRNEAGRGVQRPQSNFLYIGTVEPSSRTFAAEEENGANHSPYHKLTSAEKFTSRYRPSPELQPLPPLVRPVSKRHSRSIMSGSSEDDESLETSFYTPNGSSSDTPAYNFINKSGRLSRHGSGTKEENNRSVGGAALSVPHSRRTSPKSNLYPPSPPQPPPMPVMIPSIKPLSSLTQQGQNLEDKSHQRPRFPAPPPQPNLTLIPSLSYKQPSPSRKSHVPSPPPPPPPPPPPLVLPLSNRSLQQTEAKIIPKKALQEKLETPISTAMPSAQENTRDGNPVERQDSDDMEGGKTKLKPLHWDKVRAISHRETVWDQLKSSSFQ